MIDNRNSTPVNKTAALVLSKGFNYVSSKKVRTTESANPFLVRPASPSELSNKDFTDCTGLTSGRLTVIGLYNDGKGWSCRCSCGMYCIRRTKSILNEKNTQDRCEECRHLAFLKRDDKRRRTGKDVDVNDY